jgi:transposase-like protein
VAKYFSLSFKQRMVERMTGAHTISATRLAKEVGVSQDSLSRWLREASSLPVMPKRDERGPRQWTLDEKIRLLAEARGLSGAELTAFLEREQVLLGELEQWRRALEGEPAPVPAAIAKQLRTLERELARKDKALAEAAALLVLKKTPGDGPQRRGRRRWRQERDVILGAVAEARASGARLTAACCHAGVSARTVQRWRRDPGDDRRRGPVRRSPNALTTEEEGAAPAAPDQRPLPRHLAQATGPLPCRRGRVLGVGIDALSAAAAAWPARPGAADSPRRRAAREANPSRDRQESGLELGHHLASDDGARAVPVPLPHHGRLEPAHRRLDGRRAGELGDGGPAR